MVVLNRRYVSLGSLCVIITAAAYVTHVNKVWIDGVLREFASTTGLVVLTLGSLLCSYVLVVLLNRFGRWAVKRSGGVNTGFIKLHRVAKFAFGALSVALCALSLYIVKMLVLDFVL